MFRHPASRSSRAVCRRKPAVKSRPLRLEHLEHRLVLTTFGNFEIAGNLIAGSDTPPEPTGPTRRTRWLPTTYSIRRRTVRSVPE